MKGGYVHEPSSCQQQEPGVELGRRPLAMLLRWVQIPGGTCRFGDAARPLPVEDLLVALTPLTYGQAGRGDDVGDPDLPVTDVDHAEAGRLAALVGGRLPTSVEWEWAAAGPDRRTFPWGERPWTPRLARLRGPGADHDGPGPVAGHVDGATPQGLLDLAGNVWEWTASPVMGGGYVIRGGSYASKPLYGRSTFLNAVHAQRRSCGIGVRPVRSA
jgi:formylglycine-generating enzyme required for sulfatase activity